MKKASVVGLGVLTVFSLSLFACQINKGDQSSNPGISSGDTSDNVDPVINGVQATANFLTKKQYDLLAGVTAFDEEDGNISDIKVEIVDDDTSGFSLTDGRYVTFTNPHDYEIKYSVTDSKGGAGEAWMTATVTNGFVKDETQSKTYDDVSNMDDFALLGGEISSSFQKDNSLKIELTKNFADGQNGIQVNNISLTFGHSYSFTLNVLSASEGFEGTLSLKNKTDVLATSNVAVVVESDGTIKSSNIALNVNNLSLQNDVDDGTLELVLKANKNDNPLSFSFDKLSIGEKDNNNSEVDLFKDAKLQDTSVVNQDNITSTENPVISQDGKSATLKIKSFGNSQDGWRTHWLINTGITLKAGQKYKVSYDLQGTYAQSGINSFVGTSDQGDPRLYNLSLEANTPKTISYDEFSPAADMPLNLFLHVGKPTTEGTQDLTFSNLKVITSAGVDKTFEKNFEPSRYGYVAGGMSMSYGNNGISFYVEKGEYPDGEHDWDKTIINDSFVFEPGKNYKISIGYSLTGEQDSFSLSNCFVGVIDTTQPDWGSSLVYQEGGVSFESGEDQTFEFKNTFNPSVGRLRLQLNIGGNNSVAPFVFTINSITINSQEI